MSLLVFYAGMFYDAFPAGKILPSDIPDGSYCYSVVGKNWWKKSTIWEWIDRDEVPKELKALVLLFT